MSFLGVRASIVNVRVGKSSAPHHYTSKRWVALVFGYKGGELVRRDVVYLARRGTVGSQWSSRYADKDLSVCGGGSRYK
jgi:hypothetical protein